MITGFLGSQLQMLFGIICPLSFPFCVREHHATTYPVCVLYERVHMCVCVCVCVCISISILDIIYPNISACFNNSQNTLVT